MFDKFSLLTHLAAIRKYLLLRQEDIMLETEPAQPATQLFPNNLAGILETAVRGHQHAVENADVLERLDVCLLEIQNGDIGCDVFSLDYHVSGFIGVVLTHWTMVSYFMPFNALWKAKRVDRGLS